MKNCIIRNCLMLIAIALLFVVTSLDASQAVDRNVTFECQCENTTKTAGGTANQTTYSCDCETFLGSGNDKRRCFYDCSSAGENYTCQVNETCERIVFCNDSCHQNATCKYTNGTYSCMCNEGFSGDGLKCEPQCKGCNGMDCNEHEPKSNCSCENKSYCCTTNQTCPHYCPNCKEETCLNHTTERVGNLICWCNKTCGRADGNFSAWSEWSKCSKLCGVGTQNRTRNCTFPNPMNKGKDCEGNSSETQTCNIAECPTIGFSNDSYNVKENDGNIIVHIDVISGEVVKNFNISILVAPGESTAKDGNDYSLLTKEVTFTPGDSRPKNISINLKRDYLVEEEEHFSIMFTVTDEDVNVSLNTTRVTIEDSDQAKVYFNQSHYSAAEKTRTLNVTVILDGNLTIPVDASLNTTVAQCNQCSANATNDYTSLVDEILTFQPNGSKSVEVQIDIIADDFVEKNETFWVILSSLSPPKLVVTKPNHTVITILNDDVASVKFERDTYMVAENDEEVVLQVVLTGNIAIPVTARLNITSNSAGVVNENISNLTNGEIKFQPNDVTHTKNVSIQIKNNDRVENNVTFSVTLLSENPKLLKVGQPNETVVTILDNDVHGNFTKWSNWSYCSKTCGVGIQERNRTCTNPSPKGEGKNCTGNSIETKSCNVTLNCPGTYNCTSLWSNWTSCNVTCGPGYQFRNRTQYNIVNDISCNSTITQLKKCNMSACTVAFVKFGRDNYTVSENDKEVVLQVVLTGNITSPVTARLKITNNSAGVMNENISTPTNGEIEFQPNDVTHTKNVSIQIKNNDRVENNVTFSVTLLSENSKLLKVGQPNETVVTILDNDVHGNFTNWSEWSNCACGVGIQERKRTCTKPSPKGEGKNCTGNSTDTKPCNVTLNCPEISNWSNWTECNATCGDGFQTRWCLNGTGYGCNGTRNESKKCPNLSPCPVDGLFSEWSIWSQCTKTCGSGSTIRTRECTEPKHGGKNCSGQTQESSICTNPTLCPEETGFGPWSEWGECNVSCLTGIQPRARSCRPGVDNTTCNGSKTGIKTCDAGPCPIPGNWSNWESWSDCPGQCGSGLVNRTRKCNNPSPKHGGANCTGTPIQVKECNHSTPCTGESGFTGWSKWTPCSATCDNGKERRTRKCRYKTPHGECENKDVQEKLCYHRPCPVNGEWSTWQDWSRCSSSCGSGVRVRKRTCSNPRRSDDGLPCYGKDEDQIECVMPDKCKDDYAYRSWGSWSDCNATECGYGVRKRERQCWLIPEYPPKEPEPPCKSPEKDYQYIQCYTQPCPIKGNFTNWSFWSLCSASCGKGVRQRTRNCTHPPPSYGGADCTEKMLDVEDCPKENISCPDDNLYEPWGSWSNCSRSCQGVTQRARNCKFTNCTGSLNATKVCNTKPCDVHGDWSEWTQWSSCDLDQCGPQQERRARSCDNPRPQAAGKNCIGDSEETAPCSGGDPRLCPKVIPPAGWTDWSWWKSCSKSCNGGVRSRHRKCNNPRPTPGGSNCTGNFSENEKCNIHPCSVNGNFTEWSPWTNCTESCGGGTRERNRTCNNPKPQHGGSDCVGPHYANESCNVHECPIDGRLTEWSGFSFCSKPCSDGLSMRTRSCTNPPPQYGGRNCSCNNTEGIYSYPNCTDHLVEEKKCNNFVCPPVKVVAKITFNNSKNQFDDPSSDDFKNNLKNYILKRHSKANQIKPAVGIPSCSSNNDTFTCTITVSYNFSDGDQLPILRDTLDKLPGSNISLVWMNSSVVFSSQVNITATVLSSTSIKVNWTIATSDFENMTSITVFYKILNGTVSFRSTPVPASVQGGVVLENLEKYTWYKITVSPTTKNGTGIPSRFATKRTKEDVPSKAPYVQITSPNSTSLNVSWRPIDEHYLHGVHRGYCLFCDGRLFINTTVGRLEEIISGLRPYTKHFIQVSARTTPGCGTRNNKSFFTLEDKPDAPPQNLIAYNESSTSLRVEWEEVNKTSKNGIILGYRITYTDGSSNNSFNITSATIFNHLISELSVWTRYNVTVTAYTKVGLGPAAHVNARTEEGTPTVAPEIVKARHSSSSSIYIEWKEIGISYGKLLGYQITYTRYDNADKQPLEKFTVKDRVPLTTTNYTLQKLFYYWRYEIKIGGYTRPGVGTNATRIVRTDEHPPGRSPENVDFNVDRSTSFYIYWDEVASNFVHGILLGYVLKIQKTNDASDVKNVSVNATPKATSTYYVNNVQKYTEYTIWIRARNSKGPGKLNSKEGYQVRTKEDAPDAPPSNIRVKSLASISSLNLEWDRIAEEKANGIIRGYYVEYTATNLNGLDISSEKQEKKVFRVRGNRYSTILKNLIPGSTYAIRMFGYTIKNGTKSIPVTGRTCKCPEYLKVNWWKIPPYTNGNELKGPGGIFSRAVEMMLEMCGTCPLGHGKTKACYSPGCGQQSSRRRRAVDTFQQESFQQVLDNIKDDVDISFPIQGNKYLTHYGGIFPYISVVETSGSAYFTVKKIPSTSHVILKATFYSIPMLLLFFLLSVLAGFVIWILERSTNPTSFPLSFTEGLRQGFWWAFISASTVGYGDRRPVTIPGRVFGITWILVGYVIITLLTSLMVSSITSVIVTERTSIYGAKVAAIQNSTEYGRAIRQNGKVQPFSNVDTVIQALKDKVVDGAMLDMYAAAARKDLFQSGEIQLRRHIEYPSGYGIVLSGRMKHSAPMINEYFKTKENELSLLIQTKTDIVTQKQNQVKEAAEKKSGIFDATSEAFQLAMFVLISLLTASLVGGLFWQYRYHAQAVKVQQDLRNSAPGYGYYKQLRKDVKKSCEDHFKELMSQLKKVKQRHIKELKLLAKYHKSSGGPVFQRFTPRPASSIASLARIRKMTASVTPSLNSHHNIALQVLDIEGDPEKQHSNDSQV